MNLCFESFPVIGENGTYMGATRELQGSLF
jgi:hypothetical protein